MPDSWGPPKGGWPDFNKKGKIVKSEDEATCVHCGASMADDSVYCFETWDHWHKWVKTQK